VLFLGHTVLAEFLGRLGVRGLRIDVDIGAVVHAVILGETDHHVVPRLQHCAPRDIFIALQFERRSARLGCDDDDTIVHCAVLNSNLGLFLRENLESSEQGDEDNSCSHDDLRTTPVKDSVQRSIHGQRVTLRTWTGHGTVPSTHIGAREPTEFRLFYVLPPTIGLSVMSARHLATVDADFHLEPGPNCVSERGGSHATVRAVLSQLSL